MARHKMVNGNKVFFTQAEENERDAREAQWLSNNQAEKDAEAAALAKKASGKQLRLLHFQIFSRQVVVVYYNLKQFTNKIHLH